MKSGERVWVFLKENRRLLSFAVLMTLFSLLLLICKMSTTNIPYTSKQNLLIFGFFMFVTLISLGGLGLAKVKKWRIEKVYLLCGIILGFFYCLCLPIGRVPDETGHFMRAYSLTEGQLIASEEGLMLPNNITKPLGDSYDQDAYIKIIDNLSVVADTEYDNFHTTLNSYTPFSYLLQMAGIWIGRILQLPIVPMMLLCRILNMVCCVIVIYFCIKYIPILKNMVFLIAMFPCGEN